MPQKIWKIPSRPPHDFYLCLDVGSYFDHEHQPEDIFETGFTRPLPLGRRDILVTLFFNGEVESPEFTIRAHESLSESEQSEADLIIRRILGTDLDLAPFYDQAGDDPVLSPLFQELYGLKRISRANFFEDAVNRIIRTQIKHKPTARKMIYEVRKSYGTRLEFADGEIPGWPRPERLQSADPVAMKKHGLSLRKGEYLVGLARELLFGELNYSKIESMAPGELYERLISIRGIGPTTAQDLILFRNRTDGYFASHMERGREKAVRRWIILAYGKDPDRCDDKTFGDMIRRWKGYEAAGLEFLYVNWILSEKKASPV